MINRTPPNFLPKNCATGPSASDGSLIVGAVNEVKTALNLAPRWFQLMCVAVLRNYRAPQVETVLIFIIQPPFNHVRMRARRSPDAVVPA